VGDRELIQ